MTMPVADRDADAALVARLRAGDEEAFLGLVDELHASLTRVARTFVGDAGAAEEVVQDTWVGVLTGLDRFEGRSSLKTWIFRILGNRARTRGVKDRRQIPFSALEGDTEGESALEARFTADGRWKTPPTAWDDTSPEHLVARREVREALDRALTDLPPAQRAVITLRDVEGLAADDVCDLLQITDANQRVLLHRARVKVRDVLAPALGRDGDRR